jgi:hypothetical protein
MNSEDSLVSQIKDWRQDPITQLFWQYVMDEVTAMDAGVHRSLAKHDIEEAKAYNAGKVAIEKLVREIPNEMIDDAIEQDGNK